MKRQRPYGLSAIITMAAAALLAAACSDSALNEEGGGRHPGGTPVVFEISRAPLYAAAPKTRAVPEPRQWKDDDRIQILAKFTKAGGDTISTQYGCYKYKDENNGDGDWAPDTESDRLVWPVGSDSAVFEAYYIDGLAGRISIGGSSGEKLLGSITEGGDPLFASSKTACGHSVAMTFGHLCTHLTLTDVKADLSEGYWLFCAPDSEEIPNAYELEYTADSALDFKFTKSGQNRTEGNAGHYYIPRQRNANDGTADFYLAPGSAGYKYGDCELTYRFNRPYLSFRNVASLDTLQAGTHYELSIEKEIGVIPQPETDFPEEPDSLAGGVNIPDLLEGIVERKDVTDSAGSIVLKADSEPYPRLLRDIDFKNFNPLDYIEGTGPYAGQAHQDWKLPVFTGTLDGGFHSFINVAYPIFDKINNGKIYNLAIRDSESDISVEDIKKMEKHHIRQSEQLSIMTDFGLIACTVSGHLENILMENVSMTVHLDSTLSGNIQNRAYRIGCVAGNQETSAGGASTSIEQVKFGGEVSLTVTTDSGILGEVQDCYIGAVTGQSGAVIDDVSQRGENGKCKVTTTIKGLSTVYTGGLVGRLTNTMRNVALNAETDCAGLHGLQAYVGGLCGEAANETGGHSTIESCNAVVTVKGGTAKPVNTTTHARAYTGGIAGRADSVTCRNISITGSVAGGAETEGVSDNSNKINYATGGGFGYMTGEKAENISECHALTSVTPASPKTAGVENDTGRFAGLAESLTEQDLTKGGNTALQSDTLQFIGKTGKEPTS